MVPPFPGGRLRVVSQPKKEEKMKNNKSRLLLNPFHISGFTQADGSFHVDISKHSSSKLGLRVTPKFILTQHEDSLELLKEIKDYFGCGYLTYNKNRQEYNYIINSLPKIKEKVIPHFDKYPIRSAKLISYKKLKEVVLMMENKEHLTVEGLAKIIEIAYSQNKSSSRNLSKKKELLASIGYNKDIRLGDYSIMTTGPDELDPYFLSGLVDGDGSFNISFRANKRIVPVFTIVQDIESIDILNSTQKTLGIGSIYKVKTGVVRYQEGKLPSLIEKVIPHFQEYKLHTNKQKHYEIFCKVCKMLKENQHKTETGLQTIIELAYKMKKLGKNRRLTKEEFLKLVGVEGIV